MTRRTFLRRGLAAGAGAATAALAGRAWSGQVPALVTREPLRPAVPYGVAAGDPSGTRAVVWSRTDRPARLVVEHSTTERFADVRRVVGPAALDTSDFTARVVLTDLPPGQRIFYRVLFQDLGDLRVWSEPLVGSFRSAPGPDDTRAVRLAWSADTVGQGWGINPDWGGLRLYETLRRAEPDLFVHCGDTIYADQPLQPEVTLEDGRVWRNLVTPAKSKVAETLDEFRGNYQYNLQDEHMRRFGAEVAQVVLWDDHEVRDNWYPTRRLEDDLRYRVKSVALLAARARQAFFEYTPLPLQADDPERLYRAVHYGPLLDVFVLDLRSYRGPNSENRQAQLDADSALMGPRQLAWLKAELAASGAVWKVIASDLPIGLVVRDGPAAYEAVANGDGGPPRGRELELADLLQHLRETRVRNVVWITGDVHYAAAHRYDPARARFAAFDPFWEFVAGPLHAGTFGPNPLDPTFGPEVKFVAIRPGMKPNRPPWDGLQFYGTLTIDGRTRVLTARLHDLSGRTLYEVDLEPS